MQKLSIGRKLMAGTAVMFILAALMGIVGLSSLLNFKKQLDVATDIRAHNIVLADSVVTANSEMISNQRGIILAAFSNDAAGFAKYQDVFKQSFQLAHSSLTAMAEVSQNTEEEALRNEIQSKLDEWRPNYDDVVTKAGTGDLKEADRIRRVVTAPIYKLIDKDARRMAALEMQALAGTRAGINSEFTFSIWLAGALLLLCLLAAIAVVVIVLHVTRDLRDTASELFKGAEQVGLAAAQVSGTSQALASGSSQQAASLETTSASTEQINSMARRNSESSQMAAALVAKSQQRFSQTNQSLEEMVVAMNEINTSSDKIAKIIKVIDEIAFQTNILALNAAVEAARAGEAGMGFAVVADEVRNLAQRSAQAAKDTADLIEESIWRSKGGKSKVDQVADAIRQISAQSAELKVLIEEVNQGSLEQARGLEQVARALVQMEQVTQSTAASAEESAAASEELTAQSLAVKNVVASLNLMVEGS